MKKSLYLIAALCFPLICMAKNATIDNNRATNVQFTIINNAPKSSIRLVSFVNSPGVYIEYGNEFSDKETFNLKDVTGNDFVFTDKPYRFQFKAIQKNSNGGEQRRFYICLNNLKFNNNSYAFQINKLTDTVSFRNGDDVFYKAECVYTITSVKK